MDEAVLEIINRWMTKANHDLKVAGLVLNQSPPITDIACYHAEQCVERCLNAYLTYRDVHISRTLDVNELIDICEKFDAEFSNVSKRIEGFTEYDIPAFEPDKWREFSLDEAEKAVRNAEEVMKFVKHKLRL